MLKAIVFDMDDTLVNWTERDQDWHEYDKHHLRGVFTYVARNLHPVQDFELFAAEAQSRAVKAWVEAESTLHAPSLGKVLIQALAAVGVPRDLLTDSIIEPLLHAYNWTGMPGVKLYPDVPDALIHLKANGLRLGLVTNAYQTMWMREQELERLGLDPALFDSRISSADVGYLKPHPAIFERVLADLGVKPAEAVFVGDNPESDIAGAQSTGMQTVLRVNDNRPPLISGLIVPDAAVNRLTELPAVLDRLHPGWRTVPDDSLSGVKH